MIPEMKTTEYPTRYVATDNPGVWVEQESPERYGGYERAEYREPWPNPTWPNPTWPKMWSGIEISVHHHALAGVVLDCNVTWDDPMRTSKRFCLLVKGDGCYEQAKAKALEWLSGIHHQRTSAQGDLFGGVQ